MRIQVGEYMIRGYEKNDAPSIAKHANNPRIAANLKDAFPHPYTLGDAKEWLRVVRRQDPQRNFAVATASEAIGGIGLILKEDVHAKNAEIGYWLGEEYWGRGIMSGIVRAFTDWAFGRFDIVRIYASVFASNPASARVLENAGYAPEACLQKAIFKDRRYLDEWIYSRWKES